MIIWLASYPRSGNTLLRTILSQCFGLGSYDRENPTLVLSDSICKAIGHHKMDCDWEEFYLRATTSSKLFFIKTHRSAQHDNQKTIYVVRDGRQALVSYRKFHQKKLGDHQLSLLQLVLGLDYYGGWSEHFNLWTNSCADILVLHYRDLVQGASCMMNRIGQFIGHHQIEENWINPIKLLKQENPLEFGEGQVKWQGDAIWGDTINSVFFELHGELMQKLGYTNAMTVTSARSKLPLEMKELLEITRELIYSKHQLQAICDQRLEVIDILKKTCDERLALIHTLDKSLNAIGT